MSKEEVLNVIGFYPSRSELIEGANYLLWDSQYDVTYVKFVDGKAKGWGSWIREYQRLKSRIDIKTDQNIKVDKKVEVK